MAEYYSITLSIDPATQSGRSQKFLNGCLVCCIFHCILSDFRQHWWLFDVAEVNVTRKSIYADIGAASKPTSRNRNVMIEIRHFWVWWMDCWSDEVIGRAKERGRRGQTRTRIIRRPPTDQTPLWLISRLLPTPALPYARPDAWLSASMLHSTVGVIFRP